MEENKIFPVEIMCDESTVSRTKVVLFTIQSQSFMVEIVDVEEEEDEEEEEMEAPSCDVGRHQFGFPQMMGIFLPLKRLESSKGSAATAIQKLFLDLSSAAKRGMNSSAASDSIP